MPPVIFEVSKTSHFKFHSHYDSGEYQCISKG